ncbi:hypothetical protein Hanom_Chr10g00916361 [Helianthus anomalus]
MHQQHKKIEEYKERGVTVSRRTNRRAAAISSGRRHLADSFYFLRLSLISNTLSLLLKTSADTTHHSAAACGGGVVSVDVRCHQEGWWSAADLRRGRKRSSGWRLWGPVGYQPRKPAPFLRHQKLNERGWGGADRCFVLSVCIYLSHMCVYLW